MAVLIRGRRRNGGAGCTLLPLLSLLVLGIPVPARAEPLPLSREEQARVNQAIDKGVAFLRRTQSRATGRWPPGPREKLDVPWIGYTLLPAWALLECGVPADDGGVRKVVALLREAHAEVTATYDLSLAVLFLDRLGDKRDEGLIREFALRLMAGQTYTGGWWYRCPSLGPAVEKDLWDTLCALRERAAAKMPANAKGAARGVEVPEALKVLAIFRNPEQLFNLPLVNLDRSSPTTYDGTTDNSNSQFALMALWVARRHGVPTEPSLRLLVKRFEVSQNEGDGTWSYRFTYRGNKRRTSADGRAMTTVGLFGLAVGKALGEGGDREQAARDEQIVKGLAALCRDLGALAGQGQKPPSLLDAFFVYFLYSVERTAALYDLPLLGEQDWYRWGCALLVANQGPDGAWPPPSQVTSYSGKTMVTAFPLLFLKRVHLAKDLTGKLPWKPGELNQAVLAQLRPGKPPGSGKPAAVSSMSPGERKP
jgi:hypothetical protein